MWAYARYLVRCVRHKVSRVPFGGAGMCRLVGHRWLWITTPAPQPGIESLQRIEGWGCTRCPATNLFGGQKMTDEQTHPEQGVYQGPCAGCDGYIPCDCADQLPTPAAQSDGHLLVVAAFWADPGDSNDLIPLVERRIPGSGSVVTFTREQAKQPGLMRDLRKFKLTEAEEWSRRS